jgi:hypothetical protein
VFILGTVTWLVGCSVDSFGDPIFPLFYNIMKFFSMSGTC